MAQQCKGRRGSHRRAFDTNLGKETEINHMIGTNNSIQNQRNEIEKLSKQVSSLVGRLQLVSYCSNGPKERQFDDSFSAPQWRRVYSNRFESTHAFNNKDDELPEFHGSHIPKVLMNWLNEVQGIF
ncbi:hypothetical protein CsSME_00020416 [Camellia sinensis var. sinensis]